MLNKLQPGIVWIKDYQGNDIFWNIPYKCQVYKEFSVHKQWDSKKYSVTHNNSGMMLWSNGDRKIAQLMCIHLGDNMRIYWDGKFTSNDTIYRDVPEGFIEEGQRLRNDFLNEHVHRIKKISTEDLDSQYDE